MKGDLNQNVNETQIRNIIYTYQQYVDTKWVDLEGIVSHIINTIPEKISLNHLHNYIADYCVSKSSYHPDYNKMASMICINKLHQNTHSDILTVGKILYENSLITNDVYETIKNNYDEINNHIDYNRDFLFDYFGIKTLERSYLLKVYDKKHGGKHRQKIIVERPQHMIMRVSIGIHGNNIKDVLETYDLISNKYFTHASPTLFNSGTNNPQLSSCFLLGIGDNLDNILTQVKQMGIISKWAGGIGVHLSSIRGKGSIIKGTNGISDGIVPLCCVLNKMAKYINQGGKRSGSIACYLEPWHCDIFDFCELRKTSSGNDDNRARDLFLALWIPNLFMERVKNNENWSLMCPNDCPGLEKCHGDEFNTLYLKYESENKFTKQILARDLWKHIIACQLETGLPYMLFKDHSNIKSNQKNLGTIRSSNLCVEIIEYSDENSTAVCNLASICLPKFINMENKTYDFNKLIDVTRVIVRNLNKVIDVNYYPVGNSKETNMKHRPLGIGVQGLADVYNIFEYSYESTDAFLLNKQIFETIYYGTISESCELAKKYGHYESFEGSPFSEGKLQFHLWDMNVNDLVTKDMFDWNQLIDDVKQYGTRNSLLTALMPTAGTSQIMKCYESFETYISNIFVRTTLAGEFIVINENLINKLIELDLWSEDMRKLLIINNGSIQNIEHIPQNIKDVYKTSFELSLKSIISQSADRGPFVDQSQSLNLFIKNPNPEILTSSHFYSWDKGLKTAMYYLRGSASVNPIQFGIDIADIQRLTNKTNVRDIIMSDLQIEEPTEKKSEEPKKKSCKLIPGKSAEGCLMCSG